MRGFLKNNFDGQPYSCWWCARVIRSGRYSLYHVLVRYTATDSLTNFYNPKAKQRNVLEPFSFAHKVAHVVTFLNSANNIMSAF